MNPQEPGPEPDDRLARAEAAFRDAPAPEGPSDDLVARTRRALREADERPDVIPISRRRPMIAMLKLVTAVAAAAAVTAGGLPYLTAPNRAEATTVFEEVAKKVRDARTLSYRFLIRIPDMKEPHTGRVLSKDPGLTRMEGETPEAEKVVTVADATLGKILSLDPSRKTATIQDWRPDEDAKRRSLQGVADAAKFLRSLADKEGAPVGKRKIGDVEAQGFRVEDQGIAWTVWADADRGLPLLMETTARVGDRDVSTALSEFALDPPLDDDLFQLDPPAGYTLRKIDAPIAVGEEALVNMFRLYAEASGGTFPPKLDVAAFQTQFPKEKWKGPDDPRMLRVVQSMAASVVFVQFELKNACGYAPDGVKLGDADKVLFWYRHKASQKYRAVFGDLHVEDVPADRLPEKPSF